MKAKPGQFWVWQLPVSSGDWAFEKPSQQRRDDWLAIPQGHVHVHRGDVFMIVSCNDAGPAHDIPRFHPGKIPGIDEELNIPVPAVAIHKKIWHTALHGHEIFWLEEPALEFCELLRDSDDHDNHS